jgi:hypothetical protein
MKAPSRKCYKITKLNKLDEKIGITLLSVVVFLNIRMRFHFSTINVKVKKRKPTKYKFGIPLEKVTKIIKCDIILEKLPSPS